MSKNLIIYYSRKGQNYVQQRQRRSMKTIYVRSLKHILKTSAGMTIFSFVVRAGVEHIQWQYFR